MSTGFVERVRNGRFGRVREISSQQVLRWSIHRIQQIVIPTIGLILLWALAAWYIADPFTLPGPRDTLMTSYEILTTTDFRGYTAGYHLSETLRRALIASAIGVFLAVVFGVLMSTNKIVEEGLRNVLPFWMTTPTVVIILLSMIWFNFQDIAIYFAVIVASTPFGIINMYEGAKDIDIDQVEMAHAFDASTGSIWRHIYIPHLLPYLFGSYRYIFGMVWKIVVLAEVFGRETGIGAMFRYYFQMGEMVMVLAYLMLFVVVVLTIEYVILKPTENYLFRWRG